MEAILSGLEIDATKPVNEQIGGFLRRQIETGRLTPGARLPSTADLARRWRVNTHSIQRAMKPLVAQGLPHKLIADGDSQGCQATARALTGSSLSTANGRLPAYASGATPKTKTAPRKGF